MATSVEPATSSNEQTTSPTDQTIVPPGRAAAPTNQTTVETEDTTAVLIEQTRADLKRATERLQTLSSRKGPQPMGGVGQEAYKGLLTDLRQLQGATSTAKKCVKEWREPKRRRGGCKGRNEPNKRPRFSVTQSAKNANLDIEERMAVGNDGFQEDLKEAMQRDEKYSIQAWYEGISEASAPNMFIDASYGLYFIAAGFQEMTPEAMNEALSGVLIDTLEADVLRTVERTRIKDIQAQHLYKFYEAATDSLNPVNQRPRVMLLQNIVFGINCLQSSLGWSRLEKGDVENGKMRVVRDAYAAGCKAKGKPVDYNSLEFNRFARKIKDYNTGVNRFLEAYKELGSILLLCPQLSAHRFISPQLGPRLKEAIADMNFPQDELQKRKRVHNAILKGVITILDDQQKDLAGALDDIDQVIAQPPRASSSRPSRRQTSSRATEH